MRTLSRPVCRRWSLACALVLSLVVTVRPPAIGFAASPNLATAPAAADGQAAVDALPLRFEANEGQLDPTVFFAARGSGFDVFLTPGEAVLSRARPLAPAVGAEGAGTPSAIDRDVVRMALSGARRATPVKDGERLPGVTNYLIGNDPANWRTGVPAYAAVRYERVYPGVDLVFRPGAGGRALEYDFHVAAGSDPAAISMSFTGGGKPSLATDGALVLGSGTAAELHQSKPTVYQDVDGRRRPVDGAFAVGPDGKVGFQLGEYDRTRALVIDPVITYSTYLAGSVGGSSRATAVATGPSGAVYVTGTTYAANFPVQSATQTTIAGRSDRFVTKLNTNSSGGASLVYSTYLGGTGYDGPIESTAFGNPSIVNAFDANGGVAVDASGNAYVTGTTSSADFPVTAGAFDVGCGTDVPATCNATNNTYSDGQSTTGSTTYVSNAAAFGPGDIGLGVTGTNIPAGTTIAGITYGLGGDTTAVLSVAATGTGTGLTITLAKRDPHPDAFVAKLNPGGSGLVYSTYLGGGHDDRADAIALGASGTAFVTGHTGSTVFPTVAPYDSSCGTGANCNAAVDTQTAGSSTSGSTTYTVDPGSFDFDATDVGKSVTGTNIAAGTTIAGVTNRLTITLSIPATGTGSGLGLNILARTPEPDAFVTQVGATGTSLTYSTYLGGSGDDRGSTGLAVDATGKVYMAGGTASTDFPTAGAFQSARSGADDRFLTKLDPAAGAGGLVYSTYLGGSNAETGTGALAVDGAGNAYLTGSTFSGDFPTKAPAGFSPVDTTLDGPQDAFAAKVNTAATGASSLVYSTYLGGTGLDSGLGIAIDAASPPTVTLTGSTANFPQVRALQLFGGGTSDAFAAQLNGTGSTLVYSTYIGGSGDDAGNAVALDTANNPYVAGTTASTNFPTTAGGYQPASQGSTDNAFMIRLNPASDAAIITAASPRGGPDTGGTPVVITGQNLNTTTAVTFGTAPAIVTTPCQSSPSSAGCFTINSPTQVTAVSPACAGCTTANITVTTPQGVSGSTSFAYGEGQFSPVAAPGCTSFDFCSSVRLNNGKVLAETTPRAFSLFDPVTGVWTATGGCTSPCAVARASLTLLPNGKVLRAGGELDTNTATASAYLYDPAVGTWSPTGSMGVARDTPTGVLLSTGKVLMTGGCTTNTCENNVPPVATTELYNPATGTWAPSGAMSSARWGHSATVLGGPACTGPTPPSYCGFVIVSGGISSTTNAVASAERYDPVSGSWSTGGSMVAARLYYSATLLSGPGCSPNCGKVLIAGGMQSLVTRTPLASAELYDPAANGNNRWVTTASMASARVQHSAVALPNSKVLVAGNASANFSVGERYDPTVGTWSSAGRLSWTTGRVTGATLLAPGPVSTCGTSCGKVLFVGQDGSSAAKADLYTPRPTVSAVTPTSGPGPGGTTATITGTGLSSVDVVNVGPNRTAAVGHDATNPDTTLTVTATGADPFGGILDLTAVSTGGVSAISTADRYTFTGYGYLRVTTTPAVPAQISVDGVARDSWSLNYLATPIGSHTVCFLRDIEGFDTPGCQTVSVTANTNTFVNGTYTPRGFLQVGTSPAGLQDAVISVKGPADVSQVPRDNATMYTDLTPGAYQVCWGPVADLAPPPCQNVSVVGSQTLTVIGTYSASPGAPGPSATDGFLRVITSPAVPAQIEVDGVPRDSWSLNYLRIGPGSHTVCFRRGIEGFDTPGCQTVSVTAGQNTFVTGTYANRGYLQVGTNPCCQQNAVIYLDGVPRDNNTLYTDLSVGTYTLCWGVLAGRTAPACQAVTLTAGTLNTVIGVYG